jgi:hypothetical protein
MSSELAKRIAKAIKQHEGWLESDDESDVAEIIETNIAPLVASLREFSGFIPCLVSAGYSPEYIGRVAERLDSALATLTPSEQP